MSCEQWELHSTDVTGSTFSVCLSQAERRAFEAALLKDGGGSVIKALSGIDVRKAQANKAVRSSFGRFFSLFEIFRVFVVAQTSVL